MVPVGVMCLEHAGWQLFQLAMILLADTDWQVKLQL